MNIIDEGESTSIDNCTITSSGSYLYLDNVNITVSDNILINCGISGGTTSEIEFKYEIHNNIISDWGAGIWFDKGTLNVTENLIVDHLYGVHGDRSEILLRNNNIFGNERYGVENADDSVTIDARYNWWGAANGPSGEGPGDGDPVSEYVLYDPWLGKFHVSNNKPTIEILEPEDDSVVEGVITVKGTAFDEDGNEDLVRIEIKIGDEDWNEATGKSDWSFDLDTTKYNDGIYQVSAKSYDGQEYSDIQSINLEFDNEVEPGNSRPNVVILEPEDGTVVSETIIIRGNANDENGNETIEKIEGKINNEPWEIADGIVEWELEIDTTTYDDEIYTIYVKAYDGKDYSALVSINLEFDNFAEPGNNRPTILIDEPTDGTIVSGTIIINGEVEDQDGDEDIDMVQIKLGDNNWETATGTNSWDFEIDTTLFDNGNYVIQARAYDGKDYSKIETIELEFRNVNEPLNNIPSVEFYKPVNGSTVKDNIIITGYASDDDGDEDLEIVEIKIENENWGIADGISSWNYEIITTDFDDDIYTIYARAYDGKNYSEIVSIDLEFKNIEEKINHKPNIEITEPDHGDTLSEIIIVRGNAQDMDEDDNIEKVEIKIEEGNWENVVLSTKSSDIEWRYEIDTTEYENNDYEIYVRAYDGELYSEIVSIELEFENHFNYAPIINTFELNSDSYLIGDELTIFSEIEDRNGNDDIIEILIEIFIQENSIPKRVESFGMTNIIFSNKGNNKIIIEKSVNLEKYEPGSYNAILTIKDTEGEQDSVTNNFVVVVESESIKTDDDLNILWIGSPIAIFIVAIIGLIAYKKKSEDQYEVEECPVCGEDMEYVRKYDDYYCYECEEYFEDME